MHVAILMEYGYSPALLGLSLSYNQPLEKMHAVAEKLAGKDGGHNKFLESMVMWLMVTAPRYWWQQADTYRLSTKQSESTMHTIMCGELMFEHFENDGITKSCLADLNRLIKKKDFETLKKRLPESFLQKRVWMLSYKTLRNIVTQRSTHRLGHWKKFTNDALGLIRYPNFIDKNIKQPRLESSSETGRFGVGSRFFINPSYWTVHKFLDGGRVLMTRIDEEPYNIVMTEEDIIQTKLF